MPDTASSTQKAYDALRDQILGADLMPGDRLKVDVLKEALDTSASPVREALSLLVSDQLVERIDRRGFRVASVSAEQFDEVLSLRCALEDMALRQCLARADVAWEEALVLTHHRLARAPRDGTVAYEALHKQFHMALLADCGSPILLKFCDQLYDLNIRYRQLAARSGGYGARDVAGEHEEILDAAVSRDVERAVSALMQHYRGTGRFLAELFAYL